MTPALFEGTTFTFKNKMLTLAYKYVTQSKYINNKNKNQIEKETNGTWYGDLSNKKCSFLYTVRQSLINWPLSRGYFSSWDECQWPLPLWRGGCC